MGQEDAAAAPAPVAGESAPELPPQRDRETPAGAAVAAQLPGQRPEPAGSGQAGAAAEAEQGAAEEAAAAQDPDAGPADTTPAAPAAPAVLGARERAVLDFERRRWKHPGAKEQAIRDTFDVSATRYYQILNALLDDPAALAHAPALVGRLRRIRDARQRARH